MDQTEEQKKQTRMKYIIAVIILLVLLVGGFFLYKEMSKGEGKAAEVESPKYSFRFY